MFNEFELFAVLVYAFHKEHTEISDFDFLYLGNNFELPKSFKNNWQQQNKANFTKNT